VVGDERNGGGGESGEDGGDGGVRE